MFIGKINIWNVSNANTIASVAPNTIIKRLVENRLYTNYVQLCVSACNYFTDMASSDILIW